MKYFGKTIMNFIVQYISVIIMKILKLRFIYGLWITICGIFLLPTCVSVETVSFTYYGAYQTFNVPDNVYQLHVTLRGAMGSPCGGFGGSGGIDRHYQGH